MPPELKELKNWLLWGAVWNGAKWTKRPIQRSGYGASTTNPKHWSSFDDVKQAYERAVVQGFMELREKGKPIQQVSIGGVGFVFDGRQDEDGLVFAGVDFDKVIPPKGEISSFAAERVKRLGSYCEQSVSRTGLHVILKARPLASGIAHNGTELYTGGRYFTMTGCTKENARVVAAPFPFAALAAELQTLAGNHPVGGSDTASTNRQGKFTAADREYARKVFGHLTGSLSDGLETNIEEIRSAVSAIPSSAISTEADWMKFARGLAHEAAVYKGQAEELWEILDTASRPALGYDEPDNRSRWLRHIGEAFNRDKPITIATVFDLAKKNGWPGWSPPGAPENPSDAGEAPAGPSVSPSPELKISFSNIPHRQWLYGVDLVRNDITLLGSPGGAGKTSLALGMATCLATGKGILGEQIWSKGALTSLYINAEDSRVEMLRRACAFCQQHGIPEHELDRLYIVGADDPRVQGISFLRAAGPSSSILDQAGFTHLENLLTSLSPDLVVIDPLIALCGGGNVNDNAVMSLVMRELKKLAIKYNCAVLVVLHTKKGGDLTNSDAISGASAVVNLARRAIMPVTMTEAEAKAFGVLPSERRQYFKLVDAKSNLAPLSGETWYKLENQELPNAEPPTYPHGDRVQAVVRVKLTLRNSASVNADDMKIEAAILEVVERGKEIGGQAYPYSPSLAGANNERALLPDAMDAVAIATAPRQWLPGDLKAVTDAAIKKMKTDGRLVVGAMKDLIPNPARFRKASGLKAVPI